jgi:formate/nitrite transporter FocA (FNT family)
MKIVLQWIYIILPALCGAICILIGIKKFSAGQRWIELTSIAKRMKKTRPIDEISGVEFLLIGFCNILLCAVIYLIFYN